MTAEIQGIRTAKHVPPTIEMKLQSKVLTYLRNRKDVWRCKIERANERGVPDILCCVKGKFLAIEIKSNKDKLSKIQLEQLRRIWLTTGEAWVVRDFDEFKRRFEEWVQ